MVHGTTQPDGCTYYTCFALNGIVYQHEELVLIGCDDGEPTKCRITSLWQDPEGNNMIELQQLGDDDDDDEDDERDELAIEDLVSISKVSSDAATGESGPSSSAAPLPAAAPSAASSGGAQVVPLRVTRSQSSEANETAQAPLAEPTSRFLRNFALAEEYNKKMCPGYGTDESILSIRHYEGHLVGADWTVNQWRRDGPGNSPANGTLGLRNVDNGYRVASYSGWKVVPYCSMSHADLEKVELERQEWEVEKRKKEQQERDFHERCQAEFAAEFGLAPMAGASSKAAGKKRAHPGHAETAPPPPPPEQPASKKARGKMVVAKPVQEAKPAEVVTAKAPAKPAEAPVKPAKAPAKPKTYPEALVAVLTRHGLLSRAALVSEVSKLGFDNAQAFKKALKKTQSDGLVVMSSASYYQLGAAALDALAPTDAVAYKKALKDAVATRKEKDEQKDASKKRAEKAHLKRVRAAGGLTWQAQQDQRGLKPRSGFGGLGPL